MERQDGRPEAVERLVANLVAGICGMLYNGPLDLLIERRLHAELPTLRPLQLLSLVQLADEARAGALNPEVRRITPGPIIRAASVFSGTQALMLDALSDGATGCWAPYRALDTAELSERLWRHWRQRVPALGPGDEYDLVDEFADLAGLRDWYAWQADAGGPPAPEAGPAAEGTSNPALLRAKHPAAVMYLLDALRRYAALPPDEVRKIALEVALTGREGLDYADPEKKYRLRAVPGEVFSGLELMCLMHAGLKRLAPAEDTGMDLDEPFLAALERFNAEKGGA